VEADALVGVATVVVIPVEQSGRRARGKSEHVHAEGAGHIDFAGRGNEVVTHHAHDGAGDDAEELFHRGPALNGADGDVACFIQPSITAPSLAILRRAASAMPAVVT